MSQSSTLFIGVDVHKDSIAVAYIAQDHGAEVIDRGTLGTCHGDSAQLIRTMPAKAKHLILRSFRPHTSTPADAGQALPDGLGWSQRDTMGR